TTAATGLAVRAAGNEMKVLFTRFLKNENSCELKVLDAIPNIHVIHLCKSFGFYHTLKEEEKIELQRIYRELWGHIKEEIELGNYKVLVLDEIISAYNYGILDQQEVQYFLEHKPEELEVILTGRNPGKELMELADYVSEVKKIKHPYDKNIGARQGIEY
ncbi:MAG: cob(I)yrinic acid a,c-diamide adenosyltransferase, partial [Lachnospiraceae bacterium]